MNSMRRIKITIMFITAFLLPLTLSACSDRPNNDDLSSPNEFPSVKIAVMSDVHYFDPSLGTTGSAFEDYVGHDRKLLAESEAILKSAIAAVKSENPDFVLITGDLTKDGELSSHLKAAQYFKELEENGKKVFVIPGNHDVRNFNASSYSGSSVSRVDNISAEDFSRIYKDFGYDEALERDKNSLSYIAEPLEGLRILAIDACRYKENVTGSVTGGTISSQTLSWIKEKLTQARSEGKTVIGMMHHALLEHFTGQKQLLNEYVIDNWQQTASELADLGLEVMFTGHMHVQDVVSYTSPEGNTIYDVETGSLVTYPNPYRIVQLSKDGILNISGRVITQINYNTLGKPFPEYAKSYLETGIKSIASEMLLSGYNISDDELPLILPLVSEALISHTKGDEKISPETAVSIQRLLSSGDRQKERLAVLLGIIYNDPAPADNDLKINLRPDI